jgi:addiction module HigA family antidote
MAQSKIPPVHPGEMLLEEFLKPMGISQYRLAKEIGVPQRRISEIVHGRRSISADTDLRLCRFFSLTDGYWLRLQAHYDMAVARDSLAMVMAKIHPWQEKPAGAKPIGP